MTMLNSQVLSQILLMQNFVVNLPTKDSILSFVCKGLEDVPGVESAHYSKILDIPQNSQSISYTLKRNLVEFGTIIIILNDEPLFTPYKDYINNFIVMIEIILKERYLNEKQQFSRQLLEKYAEKQAQQLTHEIEERKQIEEDLIANQIKFQAIVESQNYWLWEIDADGNFTYVSPRSQDVLGYTPQELIGRNAFDLMSPQEAQRVDQVYSKYVANSAPFKGMKNINLHKNGHEIIIESSGVPIFDKKDQLVGYRGIDRDVTEIIAQEKKLKLTEQSIEKIKHSIFWIDRSGNLKFVNDTLAVNLGYTKDELLTMTVFDIDQIYRNDMLPEHWKRLINYGSETFETVHQRKDGSTFPVEVSTNYIKFEDTEYDFVIATDISERKAVEENLREREENSRVTLNSIGDAVIATDVHGNITQMNPVAEKLTGWEIHEALGKYLPDIFHIINAQSRERVTNPAEKVLATGKTVDIFNQTTLISKDGSEYQIADSAAPILSKHNDITGVVLVFRDVTSEHNLQRQLIQSQKLDAIGKLAGGIAHDFNNMLGGIMGGIQLLEKSVSKTEKTEKYIKLTMDSANRAADLTQKLLSFARLNTPVSAPVSVNEILNDVVSLLQTTINKNIDIAISLTNEPSLVLGEASQLHNIFLNICINASHAMPEGGVLSVTSKIIDLNIRDCNNSLFNIAPGQYIEIKIRDTGQGMNQDILSHIFDPFFTTKAQGKGTGLGLSVVYGSIQQHNGTIYVNSEPGIGSSFTIQFPLTKQTKIIEKQNNDFIGGTGTILLIDDEPVMREVGKDTLEDCGYTVILADNGQSGLEAYKQSPDEIELVILDMVMPIMSGKKCFMELRKLNSTLPIILVSGFSNSEDLKDIMDRGYNRFIEKPYNTAYMLKVVNELIMSTNK